MSSRLYDHSEQGRRYRTPGPATPLLPPAPSSLGPNTNDTSISHHQSKPRTPSRPASHLVKSKTPATPYAMSDGHSDDMPARKRIAVACGRCRKRKIRCSGDPGGGMPCTNCKTANADGCQFLRVSSQPTSMRHDSEGSQHMECGYNIEVSRASATRGSMPPLPVPYGAEMGAHGHMMPAFPPRPATTTAATSSSYYGSSSSSSSSAARSTPASSASSTSAYNYGWTTTAPSSGDYDDYYSRDASIQQPYYPMETVMGYAPWSAAGSGAASRSRSGAVSGTGSIESLRGTGSSVDLVGSYEYSSSPHDSTSSTSTSAYAGSSSNGSNATGRRSSTAPGGSQTYMPLPTPPQHHAATGSSHLSSYAYGSYGGASSSSSSPPYHHGQQPHHASTSGAHSSSSPYSSSGADHAHHGHMHSHHHHHHHHHASGASTPSGSGVHRASVGGRR